MSARIPDTHAEAWALLPWLANGRIQTADREWVEAHLQGCAECRAEFAAQRMVVSQVARETATAPHSADSDEQRSFNKLWARIEAAEAASAPITGTGSASMPAPRASRTVRWLAAAVVVQALGLGVLGVAVNNGNRDGGGRDNYGTVANVEPRLNAPAVRIVFAPEASVATVNTLLIHQGLSIVEGPGTAGNYTAQLSVDAVASGATSDSVAAVLAKDPNVTLAQPVAH
ncbi:MAG TPA: zf-HC2 domain-containing protein [Steroidobacteraceae bacterium]|nr:zf-HC2 domain-containing protein [Steroidobacteraceae bacterium]